MLNDESLIASDSVNGEASSSDCQPVVVKKVSRFLQVYEVIKLIFGVEFSLFLYCVAFGIFAPAQQRFIYQKICLYKFDSEELCSQIDTSPLLTAEEGVVQSEFTFFSTVQTMAGSLPTLFVTLIMGAWADRFSFRVPLALPHLGSAAVTSCYLVFAYLPNNTLNPVYYGIFSLLSGLSGSASTIIMVCASYISRITSGHNRTVRLGTIDAAIAMGVTIGYLLNAFILSDGNPLLAFIIQISIHCYTIFFVFFMVRELHKFRVVKAKVDEEAGGSWLRFIFVPRREIIDAFLIFFGNSTKYATVRRYLILMLFVYTIVAATSNGLASILYAFVTLQPISLSPFYYAIFQAASSVGTSLGLVVGMRAFRSLFNLSDAALLVLGILSRIFGLFVLGFGGFYPAYAPWLFSVVSALSLYPYVIIRSGLSKLTEECEHGRIFSALSLFENATTVLTTIGLNALYAGLVSTSFSMPVLTYLFHGFTLFFSAGICATALIIAIWLGKHNIKNWSFNSI